MKLISYLIFKLAFSFITFSHFHSFFFLSSSLSFSFPLHLPTIFFTFRRLRNRLFVSCISQLFLFFIHSIYLFRLLLLLLLLLFAVNHIYIHLPWTSLHTYYIVHCDMMMLMGYMCTRQNVQIWNMHAMFHIHARRCV